MKKNRGNNWLTTCCLLATILLTTNEITLASNTEDDLIYEDFILRNDGYGLTLTNPNINVINKGTIISENHSGVDVSNAKKFINKGYIQGNIGLTVHNQFQEIINNGIIKGNSWNGFLMNYIPPNKSAKINNTGIIEGQGYGIATNLSFDVPIAINNEGMIKGNDSGINLSLRALQSNVVNINNKGTISGGIAITSPSGSAYTTSINNYGLINRTKHETVLIRNENKGILNNNGVLVGQSNIISGNLDFTNNGIIITLDNNNNISKIINGKGGNILFNDNIIKTIINGNINENGIDSSTNASALKSSNNLIINGVGTNKGALIVNSDTQLTDSIVNGYNTAIYLEGTNKLSATNTTFNGGGLNGDISVIKGDRGNNSISLIGSSTVNGSVDLGEGNDNLDVSTDTQLNGDLNGGIGTDTLSLGNVYTGKGVNTSNLNILHNISGFETINANGNITLFETTTVTDADNINLESGELILRIDPTKKDENNKVIGHALYENIGTINSTGGKLIIGLNGLGENTTISMGKTTISPGIDDDWWKDTDNLKTNSLVLDGKLSSNGKDIDITVKELIDLLPPQIVVPHPPVNPPTIIDGALYVKLNKVYKSIVSAGEIGKLANTTLIENIPDSGEKTYEDALGGLLTILDQIYANNPYTYTLKSNRDSLKIFEDNMSYLTIKPNSKEWLVQGKDIYTGVKNDNDSSGKNYYGFDTGHRNYKTTTNTVGGIATFEYGLSDKTAAGFVFGGNNQDINFKGTSSIDGNSLYLGTFAKTEKNQFKFMTGLGYQYTSNDVDRSVSNQYDSFKTDEKYDVNSLNAFIEGKYSMNIDNQIIMEPKIKLSYYYLDQDKIDEGYTPGQISIKAGKATSSTGDLEIGIDFKKELIVNKGKLNNIVSIGIINTIGTKEKSLHGNIIGKNNDGSTFDIQGVKLPTTSGKVAYNMEFEQPNGMIYSTGLNFEFAKDNNRNINVTLGLGYRF